MAESIFKRVVTKKFGIKINDQELLLTALTHSSYSNEHNATECKPCPEGKSTNGNIGQTSCECSKGCEKCEYYKETNEDAKDEKDIILPQVEVDDVLKLSKVIDKQHFTEPPAKYSEASLVKKMEELGIGRPSTYASIISVLQERGYVKLEKKRFIPEDRGIVVNAFLKLFFTKYVEYDYTLTN